MSTPGAAIPYFVLERDGAFYYRGYGQSWTSHLHFAAQLSETLAEKLVKRYPGAVVEKERAYAVEPLDTLASVGEPNANRALEDAVLLAKRDGQSLETISVTVEKRTTQQKHKDIRHGSKHGNLDHSTDS